MSQEVMAPSDDEKPQKPPADTEGKKEPEKKEEIPEYEIEEVVEELRKKPTLKNLSQEQLRDIARVSIIEVRQESYSGPLPHPTMLEGYEEILPGAANRILEMAESNSSNRISINHKIVDSDNKRSNRGQILGFILSIIFIVAAVICAYLKQPIPASFLGVSGFSSIISIFVLGKR